MPAWTLTAVTMQTDAALSQAAVLLCALTRPKPCSSVPKDVASFGHGPHPLAALVELTEGIRRDTNWQPPYGLTWQPTAAHEVLRLAYGLGLRYLHDPSHGNPVEIAIPDLKNWNCKVIANWPALSGFIPREPFVMELVRQGYAYFNFPLPPMVHDFAAIEWERLFTVTVSLTRQHPALLHLLQIGFGYSQGGLITARLAELATGTSGEEMAKRLLCTKDMGLVARNKFIGDMNWLGERLGEIDFQAYCAGTPHKGIAFTTARPARPIHRFVEGLNPHLVPSYAPNHLGQFSAEALAGQVIVTARGLAPLGTPIQWVAGAGMRAVYGLSHQTGPHDLFVSAAASLIEGVESVHCNATHIGFPSSPEGAMAVLTLMEAG